MFGRFEAETQRVKTQGNLDSDCAIASRRSGDSTGILMPEDSI
jgi:hypothetical protein